MIPGWILQPGVNGLNKRATISLPALALGQSDALAPLREYPVSVSAVFFLRSFIRLAQSLRLFTCMSCAGAIVCFSSKVTASACLAELESPLLLFVIAGEDMRMVFVVRIGLLSLDESRLK